MTEALYTWMVPDKLMASRRAQNIAEITLWAEAGVTLVINLDTLADDVNLLGDLGVRQRHIPIPDFTAPDSATIVELVREINAGIALGGSVCVHCRAGLGRTGTVVSAWFVDQGLEPDHAIRHVRALRPGSIETSEQEAAVRAFAHSIWRT